MSGCNDIIRDTRRKNMVRLQARYLWDEMDGVERNGMGWHLCVGVVRTPGMHDNKCGQEGKYHDHTYGIGQ